MAIFTAGLMLIFNRPFAITHIIRRFTSSRSLSAMAVPQTVSVRAVKGDERMQISFRYHFHEKKSRVFNMDRVQSENLGSTLARLTNNITSRSKPKKKKKNKQETSPEKSEEEEIVIFLHKNGVKLEESIPNSEAWVEGVSLQVGESQYQVVVNPPKIKSLKLPSSIMSGFEVYPKLDAEFVNLEKCKFIWYREVKQKTEAVSLNLNQTVSETVDSDSSKIKNKRSLEESKLSTDDKTEWEEVHCGNCYLPVNSDIGSRIKLSCIAADQERLGEIVEVISGSEVTAGPGYCPFENRHAWTEKHEPRGSFRLVSYNILADLYADSDFSRTELFPYCPPYALAGDYRKQLLMKELLGYNADLVCLQEVDRGLFTHDLLRVYTQHNMDGILKLKGSEVNEGTAVFYNRDKFRVQGQHDLLLSGALKTQDLYKDLWEKVCTKEAMKEKLEARTSTLQVVILDSKEVPGHCVIVGTTHLYFHPEANHVRLLQTEICLRHLHQLLKRCRSEGQKPSLVFCGDFNSGPHSGVYQLVTTKQVPSNHNDWASGGEEQQIENLTLTHDLDLVSACGTPAYTNYTHKFHGCLDYIFIDPDNLEVTNVIPLPTHEEVTQQIAIPNMVFPSDHLALVCNLRFKDSGLQ